MSRGLFCGKTKYISKSAKLVTGQTNKQTNKQTDKQIGEDSMTIVEDGMTMEDHTTTLTIGEDSMTIVRNCAELRSSLLDCMFEFET